VDGAVVVRIGVAEDELGPLAAVEVDVGLGDVGVVAGPFEPGDAAPVLGVDLELAAGQGGLGRRGPPRGGGIDLVDSGEPQRIKRTSRP
jgi:hypothetical protein